ncbi:MAG: SIS domain-containing protein [Chloroflexi bacterium]|nr:SIS domain-containing protein [Chloroflexota bacterium]
MAGGQHTFREIMSQPEIWSVALSAFAERRGAFAALWTDAAPDQVIVTGCGSTYYLALTAARLLRRAGVDALACPASELLLCSDSICLPGRRTLMIAVSRSGTTTETVRAQEQFKARIGGSVVAVTCDSASPLALAADLAIAIDAAQERSVAQTRSFSSMALVIQQMAAHLAGEDLGAGSALPELCRHLLESYSDLARSLAEDAAIEKFFFLGSGALYGIACEAMLKMKEMSLSYSEAYHTLEFRHGPMSMAGEDSLVIGLISPLPAKQEIRVLREMGEMGARPLAIAQSSTGLAPEISLPADQLSGCSPILYLPVLQLLAYYRAIIKGCNPDRPQNLSAVISLDDI